MKKYFEQISDQVREYFHVLEPNIPDWLEEYIDTEEMQRIGKISMDCGNDYTDLFPKHPWYSNLDHSVGVALILWHFTHDKKQTLAGLFHDIATPTFKHCIDFMNGDTLKQESTEERTEQILKNSKEIMSLLERDHIKLEEVSNYKIYPLADNDTPKLAADRFEYNFSCSYIVHPIFTLEDLKDCYDDISILKNEDGIIEFGFNHIEKVEKYIHHVSKLWPWYICDEDRIAMQYLGDTCKYMNRHGYLSIDDLYEISEEGVISRILNSNDNYLKEAFFHFQKATKCYKAEEKVENVYCINIKVKRRYISPLVKINNEYKRAYDVSKQVKEEIDAYMKLPVEGWVYFDFNFDPNK